jgi:hypothetical protein
MIDLLNICEQAGVLKRMGEGHCRTVTVDYVPARESMAIPRNPDEDEPIEPNPPEVKTVVFNLESAQFGGVIFAAITCGERVVINPWQWVSYEHLATQSISRR